MNWEQLQAIVWLRWRLSWNRFTRSGTLNAVVAVTVLALLTVGAIASGAGGLLTGLLVFAKQPPKVLLAVWDGIIIVFLIFWLAGLVAEIQRAESLDISKLLHLPLTLQQVFVFNYLASHLSPAIVLFAPGMLGLSLGLALAAGLRMALLIPLVLSFLFMITAWTYCLRGWLSALMVNKRRRRAIVVWISLGFVLLFQLPGVVINSFVVHKNRPKQGPQTSASSTVETENQDQSSEFPKQLVRAHLAVPPGWLGYGAMTLKENTLWPSLAAAAAGCLLGALGLMRSYRTTLRFYQGAEMGSRARIHPGKERNRARRVLLVERGVPWLPDDTAALALATLRSLSRAPELKMSLIMPIVAGAALTSVPLGALRRVPAPSLVAFAATAAAILAVFSFTPVMGNTFGLDRNAFRGLVLLPTRRDHILLAKNLAFVPFVGGVGIALLVLCKFMLGAPWGVLITGLFQMAIAFLLFSLMCNVVSILAPYKMATGTLQAKRPKPIVFLALGLTMMSMPIVLSPTLIPPMAQLLCSFVAGVPSWLPVNVLVSVVVLLGAAWLYRLLLPVQGRLLQRREQSILREVTEELE